jgi:hypothetical protein
MTRASEYAKTAEGGPTSWSNSIGTQLRRDDGFDQLKRIRRGSSQRSRLLVQVFLLT